MDDDLSRAITERVQIQIAAEKLETEIRRPMYQYTTLLEEHINCSVAEFAKRLNIGKLSDSVMYQFLREQAIIDACNRPALIHLAIGHFTLTSPTALLTPKGIHYLGELLREKGLL